MSVDNLTNPINQDNSYNLSIGEISSDIASSDNFGFNNFELDTAGLNDTPIIGELPAAGLNSGSIGDLSPTTELGLGDMDIFNGMKDEEPKKKKRSTPKNKKVLKEDIISEISSKYNLNEKDSGNLRRLNESDVINVDFFLKLRGIMTKFDIKSKLMSAFNIRKSYTGFHDWYKGERIDLPGIGMDSLATNMGYSLMIVPVKNNELKAKYKNAIVELQQEFFDDVQEKVQTLEKAGSTKEPKVSKMPVPKLAEFLSNDQAAEAISTSVDNTFNNGDNATISEDATFVDTSTEVLEERVTILDDSVELEMKPSDTSTESYNNSFALDELNEITDINSIRTIQPVPPKLEEISIIDSNISSAIDDSIGIEDEDEDDWEYDDSIDHSQYGKPKQEKITKSILD